MTTAILQGNVSTTTDQMLYMSIELSNKTWKLGFSNGACNKMREINVTARDVERLQAAISRSKKKLSLSEDARTVSCYEAGRDGFWLHRYLKAAGIDNLVVDSASIAVPRRHRKKKTDRLDVRKLLGMLIRHHGGERDVWSVVRVPSVEDEDERRLHRERERLGKERTAHINRIRSLLTTHGIQLKSLRELPEDLADLRQWNGTELPRDVRMEVERELKRMELTEEQLKEVRREQRERLAKQATPKMRQVEKLIRLKGIGLVTSWVLVMEFFGWRKFRNRREVGALAGMTGTPYDSGDSEREQGISKAGNKRVRAVMIELAWMWLRWQPDSELTRWYIRRFAHGSKRMRRVGIVALSRKLLVALWKYLDQGTVPAGAIEKANLAV